jgi:Flp pilus assembly protein TadG
MKEQRRNKYERGVAMAEFGICVPFITMLLMLVVDYGLMLNEYMRLTQAVHAGVRLASGYSGLPTGQYQTLQNTATCPLQGSSSLHHGLQERVNAIISSNNRFVDSSTLCVTTNIRHNGAFTGTPENNTILLSVAVRYRAIFPLVGQTMIHVSGVGPYI